MRLVSLALFGTASVLLAASTHDKCTADANCGAGCCDDVTSTCAAGARESVGWGNAATQSCECKTDPTFQEAATLSCGRCDYNKDCNTSCWNMDTSGCSLYDEGSRGVNQEASSECECETGLILTGTVCGSPDTQVACKAKDAICDDPHMQGLRGQRIDWSGVNGGWYSLVKDEQADLHVNVRLTAPLPDEFPDRQLVTGLGILSEGHSLAIEVKDPYTIDTDGCKSVYPCLAHGGLRALVDGNEVDGLLRFSRGEYVADGIVVSASNLPVECRQFGADKIWASMYDEMLQGRRALVRETIENWILKSESMAAPEWCAKYIAENDLADQQSTHAIFKIQMSTVAVRLNVGVNYQGGGELDWDGRVLPDLEFWQMDVGLNGLNINNPSLSGILGETARPEHDDNGVEVMEVFEAFRGTVEDYRVSGALGTHFALLDKPESDHE